MKRCGTSWHMLAFACMPFQLLACTRVQHNLTAQNHEGELCWPGPNPRNRSLPQPQRSRPQFCDNLHGGLNKLAETLDVARIGPQHQVCVMALVTFRISPPVACRL